MAESPSGAWKTSLVTVKVMMRQRFLLCPLPFTIGLAGMVTQAALRLFISTAGVLSQSMLASIRSRPGKRLVELRVCLLMTSQPKWAIQIIRNWGGRVEEVSHELIWFYLTLIRLILEVENKMSDEEWVSELDKCQKCHIIYIDLQRGRVHFVTAVQPYYQITKLPILSWLYI